MLAIACPGGHPDSRTGVVRHFEGREGTPMLADMFVRYYTHLPFPFRETERALTAVPADWLRSLAHGIQDRGEALFVEVGARANGYKLATRVEVDIREPVRGASRTILPLSWTAVGGRGLFPLLQGDLEVARLGPECTHLAISARYQLPLGAAGTAPDRDVLHRIAEAAVKDFLDRTAHRLRALVVSRREAE